MIRRLARSGKATLHTYKLPVGSHDPTALEEGTFFHGNRARSIGGNRFHITRKSLREARRLAPEPKRMNEMAHRIFYVAKVLAQRDARPSVRLELVPGDSAARAFADRLRRERAA